MTYIYQLDTFYNFPNPSISLVKTGTARDFQEILAAILLNIPSCYHSINGEVLGTADVTDVLLGIILPGPNHESDIGNETDPDGSLESILYTFTLINTGSVDKDGIYS